MNRDSLLVSRFSWPAGKKASPSRLGGSLPLRAAPQRRRRVCVAASPRLPLPRDRQQPPLPRTCPPSGFTNRQQRV